jgi:acyl phosphate:glycerol-3-phosphate acyltransferase
MGMTFFIVAIVLVIAYLFGSIPTSLVIGKVFFKTDIRQHGSGNLGGTNAGRVLGRKVGVIVAVLDILKVIIGLLFAWIAVGVAPVSATQLSADWLVPLAGAVGVFGHVYPVFAQFKGGKAVSSVAAIALFTNFYLAILGAVVFFSLLKLTKFVSLSSMTSVVIMAAASFVVPYLPINGMISINYTLTYSLILVFLALLLIWRHRANIERLRQGTERKVTWL